MSFWKYFTKTISSRQTGPLFKRRKAEEKIIIRFHEGISLFCSSSILREKGDFPLCRKRNRVGETFDPFRQLPVNKIRDSKLGKGFVN